MAAGQLADFFHIMLNDCGNGHVTGVAGFAILEVNVRVLGGAGKVRMLRIERARTEGGHCIVIKQLAHILVIYGLYLLHFVAGTETIEEVDEGDGSLDGGKVSYQRKVHDLLNRGGRKHGKAGLAAAHNVAVITEYAQRMVRKRAGGHVEHAGQQLAGDLVHVGNH